MKTYHSVCIKEPVRKEWLLFLNEHPRISWEIGWGEGEAFLCPSPPLSAAEPVFVNLSINKEPRSPFPVWRNRLLGSLNVYKYGFRLLEICSRRCDWFFIQLGYLLYSIHLVMYSI
jgi:hypothetical protein